MDEEFRCGCERRHTRTSRWRRTLGLVALVVGVGVVSSVSTTVVWAAHDFPDVPGNSPHHADISWAVDYGIAQGFADGTFRPTQAVSRQTMATFLRRLSAEFEVVAHVQQGLGAGNSVLVSVECPPGKRPLTGSGTTNDFEMFMTDSYPLGSQWFVRWEKEDDLPVAPNTTGTVYALCAPGL